MPRYKITDNYTYFYLKPDNDRHTFTVEVEADTEREAILKAEAVFIEAARTFVESDGSVFIDAYNTDNHKTPRIEEFPEPSEAFKLEAAGYTPLFDLLAVK